jgi:DNA-binding response OmpR family regulator
VENAVQTRVLVISGDDSITEMLNHTTEPEAFQIFHAQNGPEGIEAARRLIPEVVILDLVMPDMDGWEICREVRSFSRVPILVLSALSKPGMVAQALDEGADDYLQKPMPRGMLAAHIKRLARRARAEAETQRTIPKNGTIH